ncbi:MAG TPA: hypothetical protein VFG83_04690, partial [Kofleriaceae bacterium]|nr:hypothetical protein [Kofleriaceae bacterium]
VSLELPGAKDWIGRPMEWNGNAVPTAPDPGPLLANGSFENRLSGWMTGGDVNTVDGRYETATPSEGVSQLVVEDQGVAMGFIDVPADADRLEVTATYYSNPITYTDPPASAWLSGRITLESVVGFKRAEAVLPEGTEPAPCDCDRFAESLGPVVVGFDLAALRGERAILRVRAGDTYGPVSGAIAIDNIHLTAAPPN